MSVSWLTCNLQVGCRVLWSQIQTRRWRPQNYPLRLVRQLTFASAPIPGDFDKDGLLTAVDINMLTDEVLAETHSPEYDLDDDSVVNEHDHRIWVRELKHTWFGDADLDGEFQSVDFVQVFVSGKYETGQNAGWSEGDWNGDSVFNSVDFITAFQDGGYEQGPRTDVAAVPEPGGMILLLIGWAPTSDQSTNSLLFGLAADYGTTSQWIEVRANVYPHSHRVLTSQRRTNATRASCDPIYHGRLEIPWLIKNQIP